MKHIALLILALFCLSFFGGCMPVKSPVVGVIYADVKADEAPTSAVGAKKSGKAKCFGVLAIVAVGDCSISGAMKDGGITKIQHVDFYTRNFLGVYYDYEVTVYGE